jgi:hypothetical protein
MNCRPANVVSTPNPNAKYGFYLRKVYGKQLDGSEIKLSRSIEVCLNDLSGTFLKALCQQEISSGNYAGLDKQRRSR